MPHKHVCDGYPDCVHDMTVFDEINCIPSSGKVTTNGNYISPFDQKTFRQNQHSIYVIHTCISWFSSYK